MKIMLVTIVMMALGAMARGAEPAATKPATRPVVKAAARVVFVVDAGGAMMSSFDNVRALVSRAIGSLEDGQLFDVVVLDEGRGGVLIFSESAVKATAEMKERAKDFLDGIAPRGAPDVAGGLKAAFKLNPDELRLYLSAGRGEGDKALLPLRFPAGAVVNVTVMESKSVVAFFFNAAKASHGRCETDSGQSIDAPAKEKVEEKGTRVGGGAKEPGMRKAP